MEQYYIIPKSTINDIEESIQRKRGDTTPIEPSQMPLAIDTIPSSVDGTDLPVGGIYLTKPDNNGNPTEAYIIGYAPVVNYAWTNQLGASYFPYLQKIEFINIKNITSIGNNAFYGCTSLVSIRLTNSFTSLGGYAFYNCTSLVSINIPNSLMHIDRTAFQVCIHLEDVEIENGFNCNFLNLSASIKYSAETMVSWFEALADRTGQTAFTLTIGSTNLNKLTDEQKAIATNKNWTLA